MKTNKKTILEKLTPAEKAEKIAAMRAAAAKKTFVLDMPEGKTAVSVDMNKATDILRKYLTK